MVTTYQYVNTRCICAWDSRIINNNGGQTLSPFNIKFGSHIICMHFQPQIWISHPWLHFTQLVCSRYTNFTTNNNGIQMYKPKCLNNQMRLSLSLDQNFYIRGKIEKEKENTNLRGATERLCICWWRQQSHLLSQLV